MGKWIPPLKSRVCNAAGTLASQLLEGTRSASILVLTDSTGNYTSPAWPQLIGQQIGLMFPNFNVKRMMWNASNQDYDPAITDQAGPNGDTYIRFTGVKGRFQMQRDVGNFTSDLDIRVDCSLDDWTPSVSNMLVTRAGGAGNGFFFFVDNAGKLNFKWYESDGTTNHTLTKATALGYTDGTRHVLRATLVVATGVATIYSGTDIDGTSWTSLGTVTTGATSINNPITGFIQPYEIGSYNAQGASGAGSTTVSTGNFYGVQIRDGISGPLMNQAPIDNWMPQLANTIPAISGSPTLWIVNGSHTGATLAYLSDTTRTKMMARPYVDAMTIFSCAKNDLGLWGSTYAANWDTYLTQVKARVPAASFMFTSQCPDVQLTTSIDGEGLARRSREILNFANSRGYSAVDTYGAFMRAGNVASNLVRSDDGVHPTAAGQLVWANAIMAAVRDQI